MLKLYCILLIIILLMGNFSEKIIGKEVKNPNQFKEGKKEWGHKTHKDLALKMKKHLENLKKDVENEEFFPVRQVQRGDTLSTIIRGLNKGNLDYNMKINYKSKKIDTFRNKEIKKKLTQNEKITLFDNPMIYDSQYIWIQNGEIYIGDNSPKDEKQPKETVKPEDEKQPKETIKPEEDNKKKEEQRQLYEKIKNDLENFFLNFSHEKYKFSKEAISKTTSILYENPDEKINSSLINVGNDYLVFFLGDKINQDNNSLVNPSYYVVVSKDMTSISYGELIHEGVNVRNFRTTKLKPETTINSNEDFSLQITKFLNSIK